MSRKAVQSVREWNPAPDLKGLQVTIYDNSQQIHNWDIYTVKTEVL